MSVNSDFIAVLMAQDDDSFVETFPQLPEEQQDEFIDAMAQTVVQGFIEMKKMPREVKIETVIFSLGMLPKEAWPIMAEAMLNGFDN